MSKAPAEQRDGTQVENVLSTETFPHFEKCQNFFNSAQELNEGEPPPPPPPTNPFPI